jgi:hypothetical protein
MPKKRGGRKRLIDTDPQLQPNFQKVLEDHTAGDPMKPDSLWTNLSVSAIADRMAELGTPVDRTIVEQLLDQAKLGRRQAFKTMAMDESRDRNQQFEIISFYKDLYFDSPNPILSVDTKKRELLGNFYRDGQTLTTQTIRVFDHAFSNGGAPRGTRLGHEPTRCFCSVMAAAATARRNISSSRTSKPSPTASAWKFASPTIRRIPPSTIQSSTACSRT